MNAFLRRGLRLLLPVAVSMAPWRRVSAAPTAAAPEWAPAAAILARIRAPHFPDRDFPITRYGAVADGRTDCTAAIRKAVDACHAAGGGHVVVPGPGAYLTGAIHLKSDVDLHVDRGATLRFSTDPGRYLPVVFTRWQGIECCNYSPLIYAYGQRNIAVTGGGTLDGQAAGNNWWAWTRRADGKPAPFAAAWRRLRDEGQRGVPVKERIFGAGSYLRPNFIQPYRCRNVLIAGVRIRRSPMWEIHPVLCTNVIVRDVAIDSPGPNNDGCDPESCRDVLIEGCRFSTGDDCIAIKSGRNNDGRRLHTPSEDIVVRDCTMKDGHGGVVVGSEISGGCRNVFVEDCVMDSPHLDRAFRFKSNAERGGVVDGFFARDVTIGRVAEAVLTINFRYGGDPRGPYRPVVRDVVLRDITSRASPRVLWVRGIAGAVINDLRFVDCTFQGVRAGEVLERAGLVSFDHVTIAPARLTRSLNSPPATP